MGGLDNSAISFSGASWCLPVHSTGCDEDACEEGLLLFPEPFILHILGFVNISYKGLAVLAKSAMYDL